MEILNRAGGVRLPKAIKETEGSRGSSSKTESLSSAHPLSSQKSEPPPQYKLRPGLDSYSANPHKDHI